MKSRLMAMVLAVAFTGIGSFVPVGGALDTECMSPLDSPNEANVFALPAGEFPDWTPGCVTLEGVGTVNFRSTDALPHRAVSKGCFDSGTLSALNNAQDVVPTRALFKWDAGKNAVKVQSLVGGANGGIKYCSPSDAVEFRDGTFPPAAGTGDQLPVVEDKGSFVDIHYICSIHGPIMHGVVRVQK